ncbi:glutamate-5-semialdehyde dehydrogenase [Parasutterella muris]|jgi:gamma-glutamyl phosphate reductase|uniref:Gamma-glutamyl phosphate reductase n=2 Tax=Parasutterella TaxID=577310 RepID=A0A6L6YIN4_9BURK|nr:glutamate-5-semialdehyde dehydrogenase [Parasutterella muris]MVX57526.1 glutamate-5-semialdehyde dehydrogenase [Parasutterella muris]
MTETLSAADKIAVIGKAAKAASFQIANASTQQKNAVLLKLADLLGDNLEDLMKANALDLDAGAKAGLSDAFLDRLAITDKVVAQMVEGLRQIASLRDPIGEVVDIRPQPSGIEVGRMRTPLGVVAIIYESRPNVTIDATALCIKSGNAAILRGGSDAKHSNAFLASLIAQALQACGLPSDTVQIIADPDRDLVGELIRCRHYVDVLIPRGGKGLISRLMSEATVPMIKHLEGICHTYVDETADLSLAVKVCDNAKTQRYSPCNAMETLLVNESVAQEFLPVMCALYLKKNVELRCDPQSKSILNAKGLTGIKDAAEEDWSTEYNAPILSVKVVRNIDEAIAHINTYGSHHTDAIITNNLQHSEKFLREVDSSSVMLNTSTRFADGFEYGLGAEIGISTDKIHARGPVGIEGLTSLKYVVYGHGELRK